MITCQYNWTLSCDPCAKEPPLSCEYSDFIGKVDPEKELELSGGSD